jgi:hypothetical protein
VKLFNRGTQRLNPQQFAKQLPLFSGHEAEEPGPGTNPEKLLGPAHGTIAGRRYWMTGEPQPGSHPGQGKLFTNDDLRRGL